jgi:hypothetical protein
MWAIETATTEEVARLPWAAAIILCLLFVSTGVLSWEIGRRGARYQLKRNRWVGIRTRATFRNENTWFAAHDKAAPFFKLAGVAGVVGGLLFLLRPEGTLLVVTLGIIAFETLAIFVATTTGVRAANRTK